MTLPQIAVIVILVIPLALVSLDRLRIDVAALFIAGALGLLQFFGLGIFGAQHNPHDAIKAIAGFSQPVVITLLSLFIFTTSLDKSGITRWIARNLLKIGGNSERLFIALFSTTTALLSLIMNNLAAGALLLPSAMEVARRTGIKPSKLLIPVAYGSLLGGAATYFTGANIIVSDLLTTASPPQHALHILDFTPTGGVIAVLGILFLTIFGPRWLPDREPSPEQMMARPTGSELEKHYQLVERLWEIIVPPESVIANKTLAESAIGERFGLAVAGVWHGHQAYFAPPPDLVIHPDDILLVVGRADRVNALTELGLKIGRESTNELLSEQGVTFIEVMPSPHSQALGKCLREIEFRTKFHFTALALFRAGRSYRTDVGNFPLMLGDSLLMIGSRQYLNRLRNNPDFIVLEPDLGDQPIKRRQATATMVTLFIAILASVFGLPVYLAMLAGAIILLLMKVLDIDEAYRAINWQAIIMIAGMYSVSLAMVNTGLAKLIGEHLMRLVYPFGKLGLATGAYLLSALFTQVIGGQVSILLSGPITISAAIAMHTNPQAVAVATAIGCSASFLTPIAHPVNILMITPANYQFRDFLNIGWRLTLVCIFGLIIGLILFWKL